MIADLNAPSVVALAVVPAAVILIPVSDSL